MVVVIVVVVVTVVVGGGREGCGRGGGVRMCASSTCKDRAGVGVGRG